MQYVAAASWCATFTQVNLFQWISKKTLWISPGQFIGAYMPTNTIRLSRMEHHQPMGLFQVIKVIQAQFTPMKRVKKWQVYPLKPIFYTSFNSTGSIIFGKSWFPGRCFYCRKQLRSAGNSFFTQPKLKSRFFIWDWRDLATFPFHLEVLRCCIHWWSEHVSKGTSDGEYVTVVASSSSFDKHGQHEIENLPTKSLPNLSDQNHQLDEVFKLQRLLVYLHLPWSCLPVSWLAHGQKMG